MILKNDPRSKLWIPDLNYGSRIFIFYSYVNIGVRLTFIVCNMNILIIAHHILFVVSCNIAFKSLVTNNSTAEDTLRPKGLKANSS